MGLFKRKPELVANDKEFELDNYIVRRKLNSFFINEKNEFKFLITKIQVFSTNKIVRIEIESYSPGTLIGKGGVLITNMQKYLYNALKNDFDYHGKTIKIDIKNCKLWNFSNHEEELC